MEKKLKFGSIFGFLLMFVSLISAGIFASIFNSTYCLLGLIPAVIGFFLWVYCASKKTNWECSECGHIFKINMTDFILGVNVIDSKLLFCSKCNKKTACKPIKIN